MKTANFNLEKMEICKEINDIILQLNLTKKEFSELYGIPQNSISQWTNYQNAPPRYVLNLIKENIKLKTRGEQLEIANHLYCIELGNKGKK